MPRAAASSLPRRCGDVRVRLGAHHERHDEGRQQVEAGLFEREGNAGAQTGDNDEHRAAGVDMTE